MIGNKKVLHVGNILNNGYLHCRYLRKRGVDADCLNVDYRHCQGQPEWAEVYLNETVDEFNPDWSKCDLKGFKRPEWFFDLTLRELANYSKLEQSDDGPNGGLSNQQRAGRNALSDHLVSLPPFEPYIYRPISGNVLGYAKRILGPNTRQFLRQVERQVRLVEPGVRILNHRVRQIRHLIKSKELSKSLALYALYKAQRIKQRLDIKICNAKHHSRLESIRREYRKFYPDRTEPLSINDILEWMPRSIAHSDFLKQYDLIQAYALDPIYVMLGSPGQPFICYEHGTMRDFPFEDSARGRLYSLALKKAKKIIITNADCNLSAERLGLDNYVFIPHIIDDELLKPDESPIREQIVRETGSEFIFVAPSRHHWKHCPAGLENSWFKRNDIMIRALGKLFANNPDLRAHVVFFEWGQEVDLSKELIAQCGFSDKVRWVPIQSKPAMKDYYCAADVILDQFNDGIGTFGAVVPESMACAKPVILNYKEHLHYWCYPQLPPVINAPDSVSIEMELLKLVKNREYRLTVGEEGRKWFEKYHSSKVVIDRMTDIYREVFEGAGN